MKKYILLPVFAFILFSCNKINELTKESPCSNQAYRDSVAVVDKLAILKYAADSSITLDSLPTGLYYHITFVGSGSTYPNISSKVLVNYKAYLLNGTLFSTTNGIAKQFTLDKLIKGWQDGIPLIKKGGKMTLYIPSGLGYGCEENGAVPPNSVLIYNVDLLDFE